MEKHQVLTVLVADDEPELLGAVCQLIDWESLGFRLVGRAGNGLDALQLVEALQPDFLLTDIRMPFISGTALTRQAKAVQPLLQVAFLSGYDDFEYAKAGIEDEIVAYLLKPISMAELTEELRKIHDKIEKRLASLTRPQGGAEALRMVTATMLLDEYARPEPPPRRNPCEAPEWKSGGTSISWWRRSACPTGRTRSCFPWRSGFSPGRFPAADFPAATGRCFYWPPATGSGGCMRHWTSCGRPPAGHGAGKRWRA